MRAARWMPTAGRRSAKRPPQRPRRRKSLRTKAQGRRGREGHARQPGRGGTNRARRAAARPEPDALGRNRHGRQQQRRRARRADQRGPAGERRQPTDAAQSVLTAADKATRRRRPRSGRAAAPLTPPAPRRPDPPAAAGEPRRRTPAAGRHRRIAASRPTIAGPPPMRAGPPPMRAGTGRSPVSRARESAQLACAHGTRRCWSHKSADGTPRWLARTTAYRDRDGEILSTAALDADSQRMTATTKFGPLRWWHVGWFQSRRAGRAVGPGLDPARATFSMQIGRTRVESARSRARRWPLRWRAWPMRWNCRPLLSSADAARRGRRVYDDPHVRAQPGAGARRASVEPFTGLTVKGDTYGYFRGGAALQGCHH